jgi:hypothetical protein
VLLARSQDPRLVALPQGRGVEKGTFYISLVNQNVPFSIPELQLLDAAECARSLGHAAQATWLRQHFGTCHPSNVADIQSRLAQAEAGQGQTLFDIIKEIIADNRHVRLVLL